VNTITMADYLYRNDVARAVIVARAEAVARDSSFRSADYALAKKELESMNLPIGWSAWGAPRRIGEPGSGGIWNNIFGPILGLLLTAIAATMGAPFWFDMLNKIMVIRSTVKPHEKSPEEDSEDRQKPKPDQLRSTPAETDTVSRVVITQPATPLWNPLPTPRDAESSVDGCHVVAEVFTSDEDLPPSEGGIA